jgi:GNAT superfamily N-acetyltransferase
MPSLDFGQPELGIFQMAYIVDDIHAAMGRWTRDLRVGPWFLLDRFTGVDPEYRGAPCGAAFMLAMAFSGHMQIELIQPLDEHPSPVREALERRGYGFHHYGIGSRDFEADVAEYTEKGYEVAFRAGVPTGGSVAYLDTRGALPGYIEVIELGPIMEHVFTRFYAASLGWDGSDPVRPFG